MKNQQLDARLAELKGISERIQTLQEEETALRKEVFGVIENEGLTDGYRNDIAVVSYVERKAVKIKDENALLKDLQDQNIVRYFKAIPEQVIPAHTELTPEFAKDVKAGVFKHEAVDVETSNNLAVRFN